MRLGWEGMYISFFFLAVEGEGGGNISLGVLDARGGMDGGRPSL